MGVRQPGSGAHARAAESTRELDPRDPKAVLEAVAPKVLRVCRSVLGPHAADVDDAMQESLVALLHALLFAPNRSSQTNRASPTPLIRWQAVTRSRN